MDGLIYMAGVATCALVLIPCYLHLGRQEYRQGYKDAAAKIKAVEEEINRLEQTIRAGLRYEDLPLVNRFEPIPEGIELHIDLGTIKRERR